MEYFKIGKLAAVHGLKGELLLKHELGKQTSLKGLQAIFIEEKKNAFLPWFIESAKSKSAEEVILILERQIELQCFSAEEKFRTLLTRSPHVLQIIPHKYLASYLGIDATTFSKLLGSARL